MDDALQSIDRYGFTAVALVVLALAVGWFIRDLVKQRDRALDIAESAVNAFDRLCDQLGVEPKVRPARPRRDDPK